MVLAALGVFAFFGFSVCCRALCCKVLVCCVFVLWWFMLCWLVWYAVSFVCCCLFDLRLLLGLFCHILLFVMYCVFVTFGGLVLQRCFGFCVLAVLFACVV